MRIRRQYTVEGRSPYEGIAFRNALSEIRNPDGSIRSYVDTFSVDESVVHMRIFSNRPYSAMERASFAERVAAALQRKVDVQLVEIPTSRYGTQHAR